jgi:hypothetical protein
MNGNQTTHERHISGRYNQSDMKVTFFVGLFTACLLFAPQAKASTWLGHLSTQQDAKNACRDVDSSSCLPYMAQAVVVTDRLHDQASYDLKRNEIHIPGGMVPS